MSEGELFKAPDEKLNVLFGLELNCKKRREILKCLNNHTVI